MSMHVQLYRGAERELWGHVSLLQLVRLSMHATLGRPLQPPSLLLVEIYPVEDDAALDGAPRVVNLTHTLGYARVTVREHDRIVYQHPHQILEIVGRPLQVLLRREVPEESEWAFAIVDRKAARPYDVRPVPRVEGATPVRPYGPGEKPRFQIRRLPEEPPPLASLEQFGVTLTEAERPAIVKVVLDAALAHEIEHTRPLSARLEEGGFLVGRVYRDEAAEGTYLAELAAAPNAEHTGASLFHFTFTGDSFGAVKRALREEHAGQRLLGWFHTHLFPATDGLGLSSIDVHLHFTTFTLPWQLAALINLEDSGHRTLRFYARSGDAMVLCPHRVRP